MGEFDGHTPGPWRTVLLDTDGQTLRRDWVRPLRGTYFGEAVMAGDAAETTVALVPFCHTDNMTDARLIAAAPDLLAERDRLRAEVERLRGVLTSIAGKVPYADDPWSIALAALEAQEPTP